MFSGLPLLHRLNRLCEHGIWQSRRAIRFAHIHLLSSHVCKALAEGGFTPICYDNLSRGHAEAVQWGALVQADILDNTALTDAMRQYNALAVIHLAALTSVIESTQQQARYHHVNVDGTTTVLDAMAACGLQHLIFASSAAVYASRNDLPADEQSPLAPQTPYGQNKLDAEAVIARYATEKNIHAISFRFFNAIGAAPDGSTGNRKAEPDNMIPIILSVALKQKSHLDIFGTDYPTADGTAIRDFVHVSDIAAAHLRGIEALVAGRLTGHQIINLGTGSGHSVQQAYDAACRVTGMHIPHRNAPRREQEIISSIAAVDKAEELLGWRAEFIDIDFMINSAWQWQKSRPTSA